MLKKKMSKKSIYSTQQWLAETYQFDRKYAEQVKMAIDSVETAKQIDEESHSDSHKMFFKALARSSMQSANPDAERLYEEGLALARQMPNRKTLLLDRIDDVAECRWYRHDFPGNLKLQSEAISIEPSATRYWQRGLVYSELHDSKAAIKDYNSGLILEPKSGNLLESRAEEYRKLGEYQAALVDYSTEINERRSLSSPALLAADQSALTGRADVYMDMHDYKLAIDDLSEAMRWLAGDKSTTSRRDEMGKLYQRRAKAYKALGKEELAKADEEKAASCKGLNNAE